MNLNAEVFELINGLAYKNHVPDDIMIAFSKFAAGKVEELYVRIESMTLEYIPLNKLGAEK